MKTKKQVTVLMYHRIATADTDPWGICVAPEIFEEQIAYLSSRYPVLSIADAVQQFNAGNIGQHSLCITFDDGYADNFTHAKPVLEHYHCPATFFIPTAFTDCLLPFWWDELEYIFLHRPLLPRQLVLHINEKEYSYTINDAMLTGDQWQQHQCWKWYNEPPTDRCSVFLSVWESLRPLPLPAIRQQLTLLSTWAGSTAPAAFRLPMSSGQLQELFRNPLFTPGLHTHTHPDLAAHNREQQMTEITQNKNLLQTRYGVDKLCLAYPYGRYNAATLEVAAALDLPACFTTNAAVIDADSHAHRLGRHQVGNWTIGEMNQYLSL